MVGGAAGNEADHVKEEQDQWREGGGDDSQNPLSNSSFLPELNLVFVLLSLVSPSSDEDSNGDNGDQLRMKELETNKVCNIARSSVKKKDIIEAKPEGRRISQRFHTTIKDHRHGRKM